MSQLHPLGALLGARSGDKGGRANLGIWVPDPTEHAAVQLAHGRSIDLLAEPAAIAMADARYRWVNAFLTVDQLRVLLPETSTLRIDRFELPNLRAINFVLHGLLGRGVAESTRSDPQAKGLGEHLRARLVPIPVQLRPSDDTSTTP